MIIMMIIIIADYDEKLDGDSDTCGDNSSNDGNDGNKVVGNYGNDNDSDVIILI